MADFSIPDFLQNSSVDDIYEEMRGIIPTDIDTSQGSHTWNFLRPTALVVSEVCEYILPRVVQLIFPSTSYGEYLDAHATVRGMTRRAATAATGELTITGSANTVIPAGSVFSTVSANEDDPSVSYATLAAATIPSTGSVTVDVQCTQTGTIGNTSEGTVILVSSRINGITAVTNEAAITGGTDAETDASLQARIAEYDLTQGDSYTGNVSDYKRWAMSVDGVGSATIIPANDSTGLVTIVLTDSNGDPATEQLCTEVYNYIMSPDAPDARLAPINANLEVEPPTTIAITISATVELEDDATVDSVKTAFRTALTNYMPEAEADGEIKYTRIAAILSATEGVNDYKDLLIGESGGTPAASNISIESTELPTISASDITLTSGTV